jgi:hypothetical protein
VAYSPDIFQAKISELMATLEFVRAYIDDLLCITKGDFGPLGKIEIGPSKIARCNLKVNAVKSNFCAVETEYLGYILSRDGTIKPQPKKVQSILALTLPTSVKELCRFLGMVQYTTEISGQSVVKFLHHLLHSLVNVVALKTLNK